MKRTWEALRARDRGRTALRARYPVALVRPGGGTLDVTQQLRALHATIVPPSTRRPYWTVYHASGRYLGAGKSAGRAVAAATARTYLDTPPTQRT